MGTTSFTQLNVWTKAHQAVLEIYRMTRKFPEDEKFGLVSQMRRAAVSVPANIAEGYGRRRGPDKARFYNISAGSTEEVRYYLMLTRDLGFASDVEPLLASYEEISRMLRGLTRSTLDS